MLEEYAHLIADKSKRESLVENEILAFQFNSNVHGLKFIERFYSELAQVAIDDSPTPNWAEGFFVFENVELTVRVIRIQKFHCFDKFLIGIKKYGESFPSEDSIEDVGDWNLIDELEIDYE